MFSDNEESDILVTPKTLRMIKILNVLFLPVKAITYLIEKIKNK